MNKRHRKWPTYLVENLSKRHILIRLVACSRVLWHILHEQYVVRKGTDKTKMKRLFFYDIGYMGCPYLGCVLFR